MTIDERMDAFWAAIHDDPTTAAAFGWAVDCFRHGEPDQALGYIRDVSLAVAVRTGEPWPVATLAIAAAVEAMAFGSHVVRMA